jgi:DNA-binding response OmpR family regulator
VLLASGNPKERAAWRTVLNDPRYVISEVENGVAALKAIILEEADIIIAAVTIARLDALELLRAAHDLEQSPPIVVVAPGHSEINQVYLRTANLLGAAATYMQPFDAAEFANGINSVLSARKSRSSRFRMRT